MGPLISTDIMPRPSKADRHAAVWERARPRFDAAWSAVRPVRELCAEDRRFYQVPGAMYEGSLEEEFANKPKFEFNKVYKQIKRIDGEMRSAEIAPDFRPRDDADDENANSVAGLYRADQQDSNAKQAHNQGRREGLGGGIGAWRLRAVLEDEDGDPDGPQRIVWEPIADADTRVFYDPSSQQQDKSDARWCFVLTGMSRESFVEEYGEANFADWGKPEAGYGFEWCTSDDVYVAEYFEVEKAQRISHVYRGPLHDEDNDDEQVVPGDEHDEERIEELEATGYQWVRDNEATAKKIHKWRLSGAGVLKDEGIIAGQRIPVPIYYADRFMIGGVEWAQGHARLGKDPSRILNMQMSQLAENAATSTTGIPIVTPAQILGNQDTWAGANRNRYPYVTLNPMKDATGTEMPLGQIPTMPVSQIPPAVAALAQAMDQHISDILGGTNPGQEAPANIAQQTLEQAQNVADMDSFVYMDNWAVSMRMEGEIYLSMAQAIYIEKGRKMKILSGDGKASRITLKQPGMVGGRQAVMNDLGNAKMDIVVDIGPSFTTRRDAEVRTLTNMAQATAAANPQLSATLIMVAISKMDGEGAKEIQPWLRKTLINQGVLTPTPEEEQEIQQAQAAAAQNGPSPADQLQLSTARQADAEAAAAQASVGEKEASRILKLAQAAKTEAETHGAHVDAAVSLSQEHRAATAPPPVPPGQGAQPGQPPAPPPGA